MPSRRDLLKAGGGSLAAAVAGGAARWGAWAPAVSNPEPGTWPQPRYGPGNAAHNPHAAPPTDDPSLAGVYETSSEVDALAVGPERVYAAADHVVQAFARSTGESDWEATVDARWVALSGDTVVAAGPGSVVALSAATGSVRWRRLIDGLAYSLLADERTAYVGRNDHLTAFALESGERQWSLSTGGRTFAGFDDIDGDDDQLLVGGGRLSGYDARSALAGVVDGAPERAWRCDDVYGATQPVPVGDLTLVGSSGCSPRTTCSVSAVAADRTVEWERPLGNYTGRLATDGDRAFVVSMRYGDTETMGGSTVNVPDNTTLHALDPASGETAWTFERAGMFSAPIVASDTVYVGNFGGEHGAGDLHALDPASGDARWTYEETDRVNALAAAGDRLYAATGDGVLAFA
jgi:outer membrane protein assembly factor BamB